MILRRSLGQWTGIRLAVLLIVSITLVAIFLHQKQGIPSNQGELEGSDKPQEESLYVPPSASSGELRASHDKPNQKQTGCRGYARTGHNALENIIVGPSRATPRIIFMDGWQNSEELFTSDMITNFAIHSKRLCRNTCTTSLQHNSNQEYQEADVAVFDMMKMPRRPLHKPSSQLWVFRTGESPFFAPKHLAAYSGLFNYTMTLYLDSTIPINEGYCEEIEERVFPTNFAEMKRTLLNGPLENKALWYVSNCSPSSARIEYVRELAKHMRVDVQTRKSRCLEPLRDLRVQLEQPAAKSCEFCTHTFYLGFENALCQSYITEKLWKILASDSFTIPVVMGGLHGVKDYELVAPPNSFIHVDNFTSPKDLVDHLRYVASNDDAFNYYHNWRYNFTVPKLDGRLIDKYIQPFCDLCDLAHMRPFGIVKDMSKFYSTNDCVSPEQQACKHFKLC